jgi:hypothetical protein
LFKVIILFPPDIKRYWEVEVQVVIRQVREIILLVILAVHLDVPRSLLFHEQILTLLPGGQQSVDTLRDDFNVSPSSDVCSMFEVEDFLDESESSFLDGLWTEE